MSNAHTQVVEHAVVRGDNLEYDEDGEPIDPHGFISPAPYGLHGKETTGERPDDYIDWINEVSRQRE